MRRIYICIYCLLQINLTYSQIGSNPFSGGSQDADIQSIILNQEEDSTLVEVSSQQNPLDKRSYDLISNNFFLGEYNPSNEGLLHQFNLGNLGSSSFPIQRNIFKNIRFDLGHHNFDIYKKNIGNSKFYQSNKPLSFLNFSPFSGQGNFIVKSLYTNEYKENIVLLIDYQRILQEGLYQNHNTKNTNVDFGIKWRPRENYAMLINLFVNNHNEGKNGGISDPDFIDTEFGGFEENIPVFSTDGNTREQNYSFHINQFYFTSTDSSNFKFDVHHELQLENGYFRFYDNNLSDDEFTLYDTFITDERGIRYYVSRQHIGNNFDLSTELAESVFLKSGISHDYYKIDNEITAYTIHQISAYGAIRLELSNLISLQGNIDLGLINNTGNILIESEATVKLPQSNLLTGGFTFSRYSPTNVQDNLTITSKVLWDNDFTKPFESELRGNVQLKKLNTKVFFSQMLLNNAIYFNSDQRFVQDDGVISITKLILDNKTNFKNLYLENTLLLQSISNNIYNLPSLWNKTSLYFDLSLFKNVLNLQSGFEAMLTPGREGQRVNPVISHLYPTSDEISFYPDVNFFTVFNVKEFRFFLRLENLSNIFNNNVHYQIIDNPQYNFKFRVGVQWLLTN